MQQSKPFWFVWNDQGSAPMKKHESEQGAINEADRLARNHRGKTFIVLQSVSAHTASDITRIDLRPESEIPW